MNIKIKTTTLGAGSFKVVKEVQLETDKPISIAIAMMEDHQEPIIEIHQKEDSLQLFGGGFSNN